MKIHKTQIFGALRRRSTLLTVCQIAAELKTSCAHDKKKHSLSNHGMFPDQEDVRELIIYVTLLFIVLTWMFREVHLAFFTQETDTRELRRTMRNAL